MATLNEPSGVEKLKAVISLKDIIENDEDKFHTCRFLESKAFHICSLYTVFETMNMQHLF